MHAIIMLLSTGVWWMSICSKFTHMGFVQYIETRSFEGLVQVVINEACLNWKVLQPVEIIHYWSQNLEISDKCHLYILNKLSTSCDIKGFKRGQEPPWSQLPPSKCLGDCVRNILIEPGCILLSTYKYIISKNLAEITIKYP